MFQFFFYKLSELFSQFIGSKKIFLIIIFPSKNPKYVNYRNLIRLFLNICHNLSITNSYSLDSIVIYLILSESVSMIYSIFQKDL